MIGPTLVLTAAHCLSPLVLGAPSQQMHDLKIIADRTDLLSSKGKEIPVRDTWVNPQYDAVTNAGDFAVITLASPLPQSSVIRMAPSGRSRVRTRHGRRGLRLGRYDRHRQLRAQSAVRERESTVRRRLRAGVPGE